MKIENKQNMILTKKKKHLEIFLYVNCSLRNLNFFTIVNCYYNVV